MDALTAYHKVRTWALAKLPEGGALRADTPRFNMLDGLCLEMGERIAQGGDKLEEDLRAMLFAEVPLRLAGHPSGIQSLQDGYADLCKAVMEPKPEKPKVGG